MPQSQSLSHNILPQNKSKSLNVQWRHKNRCSKNQRHSYFSTSILHQLLSLCILKSLQLLPLFRMQSKFLSRASRSRCFIQCLHQVPHHYLPLSLKDSLGIPYTIAKLYYSRFAEGPMSSIFHVYFNIFSAYGVFFLVHPNSTLLFCSHSISSHSWSLFNSLLFPSRWSWSSFFQNASVLEHFAQSI